MTLFIFFFDLRNSGEWLHRQVQTWMTPGTCTSVSNLLGTCISASGVVADMVSTHGHLLEEAKTISTKPGTCYDESFYSSST